MQTNAPYKHEDEYLSLLQFTQNHNRISYAEFDACTVQELNLFVIPKDEHFRSMERVLDKIIRALPALKRIFTKPIIRLKDVHNVLPVESVRVINNQSVVHAALHSELWGNITSEGLKPKKLLTLDRQEDYAIYENVVFTRLIDLLLAFVKKNIRLLKDIMYAYRDMRFNLLERTNHLHYFLAIGKLHVGYVRAQEKYNLAYERCLEKLLFIDRTLRAKLHAPVYRHCKKNTTKLSLKKTNVFRLHKDYQQVYALLKWFGENQETAPDTLSVTQTNDEGGYAAYCALLAIFSIGHFNFTFDQKQAFDFSDLQATATYKNWTLTLKTIADEGITGLEFTFSKEHNYRIYLLQKNELSALQMETWKQNHPADEYLLATPTEYNAKDGVYLSLFDVDSFRRIQQLLLRGMIYADTAREFCPFCGHALTKTDGGYECLSCRTHISTHTCPLQNEKFFVTGIREHKSTKRRFDETASDKFLSDKFAEAQFYYRNITPITATGQTICPRCGKRHDE